MTLSDYSSFVLMSTIAIGVSATVSAQPYPNKPVRLVTGGAGGGTDFIARLIAQGLTETIGQQIVVENRGGSGVAAGEFVSKAPPDGYTLLFVTSSHWIGPLIQGAPYDPIKNFSPISLTTRSPNILVVHPALPVKSVRELITLAKLKPGELNYASSATGSSSHLAMELFKTMNGINIVRIPYKTGSSETNDLLTGQVQLTFGTAASMTPLLKWGKVRALAVTSAEPSVLFPNLPTVAASGVPGYESASVTAMFAPAKTSPGLIDQLNQQTVKVLGSPFVKERLLTAGVEPVGNASSQAIVIIRTDTAKWGKIIKDAGIKAD